MFIVYILLDSENEKKYEIKKNVLLGFIISRPRPFVIEILVATVDTSPSQSNVQTWVAFVLNPRRR